MVATLGRLIMWTEMVIRMEIRLRVVRAVVNNIGLMIGSRLNRGRCCR